MAEATFLLQKLRSDTVAVKPLYIRIREGSRSGWSLDQIWRNSNYPKHRVEQAARELLAMRIIDRPIAGMQSDLFPLTPVEPLPGIDEMIERSMG